MRLVAVYLFAFLATSVSLVLAGSDNVFVGVTNSRTELTKQIEFFVHPYSSQNANDIIHQHQHSHTHEPKLHYFTHSPLVSDFEVTSGDELLVTHSKYENQQVRVQVPPAGDWFFADFPEGSDKSTHELAIPFMYLSTGQLLTHGFPVRRDDPVEGVTVARELGVDALAEKQKRLDEVLQAQIERERELHRTQDADAHEDL